MKLSDLRYITQKDIDESHINITSAEMYKEFQDYNSHMLRMQQRKVRFLVDFYGMMAVDLLLIPVLCILTGKYTQITEPISDNMMFIVSTLLIGLFMAAYVFFVLIKKIFKWPICLAFSLLTVLFRASLWAYIVALVFVGLNCWLIHAIKREDDALKEHVGYPAFVQLIPSFIRDGKEFDGLDEMVRFEDSEESDDLVRKEEAPPVNPFDKYRIKPEEDQGLLRDTDINS